MKTAKAVKPNGSLGFYLIEGMPNLIFLVPSKSPKYQALLQAEKLGHLPHMFPNSENPRVSLGVTKDVLKELSHQFDLEGNFQTTDRELAVAAHKAALSVDNPRIRPAGINQFSLDPYEDEKVSN